MATLIAVSLLACGDSPALSAPPNANLDAGEMLPDAGGLDASHYVRPDGGPRLPGVDSRITLPFLGESQVIEIEIEARLRALDVHFSVDTTASFKEEIAELQDDLSDEIVPELRRRIDDVSVGVSSFEDFPRSPFGTAGDDAFELKTPITSDLRRVDSALAGLDRPIGNGGDGPECGAEALYQIATGEGYWVDRRRYIAPYEPIDVPGGGTLGGVGFRQGALHTLVHITDAPSHRPSDYEPFFPGTRSLTEAAEALEALDVRTLGIVSHPEARQDMELVANITRAIAAPTRGACLTGLNGEAREPIDDQCPLVFDIGTDGDGLSETLIDAIVALVDSVDLRRVYTDVTNDPLRFITAIEALEADAEPGVAEPTLSDERPNDGINDTFVNVRPATVLRFAVHLRNQLLVPDDAPQFYMLSVNLIGDGISLGTHRIRVEVPAREPVNDSDAGD